MPKKATASKVEAARFGEDAWEASLDALTLQLRTLNDLRSSLDPTYRDSRHRDAKGDEVARKSQDFLFGLARLQLEHFKEVLKFSNQHFDFVMEQLRRAGRVGSALAGATPEVLVKVEARIGDDVSTSFEIHNLRCRPADLRFLTTEFRRDGGSRPSTVAVNVYPARAAFDSVLDAYGKTEFRLSFSLDGASFPTVGLYHATTFLMDGETIAGRIHIQVDVQAPARRPAAAKTRKRRGKGK